MLNSFKLKFSGSNAKLDIPGAGVTIFVGPNNSGKSLVLREIHSFFQTANLTNNIIVEHIEFWKPTWSEAVELYDAMRKPQDAMQADTINIGSRVTGEGMQIHLPSAKNQFDGGIITFIMNSLLKFFILRLDGRTRFGLTDDTAMHDLLLPPTSVIGRLFVEDQLREDVRSKIFEALGLYLVVDPTAGGKLRLRLSERAPGENEQSLDSKARAFHFKALHIKSASDGIQAYVGILVSVLAGQSRVVLVDEPEAFLHPPLARIMGRQLASNVSGAETMIAATHSADFLLGCLQGNENIRVVRLEYQQGISRGRYLDNNVLKRIFKHPLIRSANVISALFYDGVIVTESDNDRVVYQEIYYRISEETGNKPSILFLNAQNKQTIKEIIGPLRQFGIPAAAIVDIDFIKDGGQTFMDWLDKTMVPNTLRNGYATQRASVLQAFQSAAVDMKALGVAGLPSDEADAANAFFDTLNQYGLFPVREGELENWLKALKTTGKKTDWTISLLESLGSDPKSANYVRPASGDVWDFVRTIEKWVADPDRKGT